MGSNYYNTIIYVQVLLCLLSKVNDCLIIHQSNLTLPHNLITMAILFWMLVWIIIDHIILFPFDLSYVYFQYALLERNGDILFGLSMNRYSGRVIDYDLYFILECHIYMLVNRSLFMLYCGCPILNRPLPRSPSGQFLMYAHS